MAVLVVEVVLGAAGCRCRVVDHAVGIQITGHW